MTGQMHNKHKGAYHQCSVCFQIYYTQSKSGCMCTAAVHQRALVRRVRAGELSGSRCPAEDCEEARQEL